MPVFGSIWQQDVSIFQQLVKDRQEDRIETPLGCIYLSQDSKRYIDVRFCYTKSMYLSYRIYAIIDRRQFLSSGLYLSCTRQQKIDRCQFFSHKFNISISQRIVKDRKLRVFGTPIVSIYLQLDRQMVILRGLVVSILHKIAKDRQIIVFSTRKGCIYLSEAIKRQTGRQN